MKLQGAVVREQGQTFAIVVVKKHVVDNRIEAERAVTAFAPYFPGLPIVLMAQDPRGTPTYFGRPDIARFLSRLDMRRIPWKEYTFN